MLTNWKRYLQSPTLRVGLLIGLMTIPNLAFAQTGGGEIEGKVTAFTMYIYNTLRWPVCFLGLMIAVGLVRLRENGVSQAVGILFATIAWALVPAIIQILKNLFG